MTGELMLELGRAVAHQIKRGNHRHRVVISASHNPYQDNGIKFFSADGFKLPDEVEAEIEDLIANDKLHHLRPTATSIGKAYRIDDAAGRYIVYAKSTFPSKLTLEGLTIVVD